MHRVLRVDSTGTEEKTTQMESSHSQHDIQAFNTQVFSTRRGCCGIPALLLLQDHELLENTGYLEL